MFHKKTFLITGAAGFIGSHMVDYLLKKKYFVIGIDNLKNGSLENIKHNFKNNNFLFLKKDLLKDKINLKKKS